MDQMDLREIQKIIDEAEKAVQEGNQKESLPTELQDQKHGLDPIENQPVLTNASKKEGKKKAVKDIDVIGFPAYYDNLFPKDERIRAEITN